MLDAGLMVAAVAVLLVTRIPAWVRRLVATLLLGTVLFREQVGLSLFGLPTFAMTAVLLVAAYAAPHIQSRLKQRRPESSKASEEEGRFSCLSGREKDVITLLLSGKTQAEAASELGLRPSTVGTYRQRAMEKLGATSLDDLRPKPLAAHDDVRPSASRWLPAAWILLATMSLCACLGGLSVCLFMATLAGVLCVYFVPAGDSGADTDIAVTVAMAIMSLTFGMLLRGVAAGFIPVVCALAVPVTSMIVASVLIGFFDFKSLAISSPHRYSSLLPLFVLGLCVGPMSPGVARVSIAGIPLEWSFVLARVAVASAMTAALATYLLVEEGNCPEVDIDDEQSLHRLQGQGLSELEAAVLLAIAQGKKPAQIADNLAIAKGTVNSYRLRGYRRLGIHSRKELADLLGNEK